MTLHLLCVLVLGLMCGSELNVAAFGHPALNSQPLDVHIAVRASFARLFGRVMPFWMASSTLLNLVLLLPGIKLSAAAWRFALISCVLQVLVVPFSLVGPVPINNRIAKWTPTSLPDDWRQQERRWDVYHWFRTCILIVAFAVLAFSLSLN